MATQTAPLTDAAWTPQQAMLTDQIANEVWNARPFLYQLGTIKLVLRGVFDGPRQEAYGGADCEPSAAG